MFEYATGGGFAGKKMPSEILCDGYGMFKAFISDLKALGCQVTVTLDWRLKPSLRPLSIDEAIFIRSPRELNPAIRRLSAAADAALVIAPETLNALGETVEKMEEGGCQPLNCPSKTINKFQGKAAVYRALEAVGVRVPKTIEVEAREGWKAFEEAVESVGPPAVVKPDQEAGCTGLSLVWNPREAASALEKAEKEASAHRLLVQEYVEGTPASVSLLCGQGSLRPLTLNRQWVALERPVGVSRYLGGFTPYSPSMANAALKEAAKAARALEPLRGYVGIDLVLASKGPVVVDVNLRLTVAYLGVRKIMRENPAAILLHSAFGRKLPREFSLIGSALYRKIQLLKAFRGGEGLEFFLPWVERQGNGKGYLVACGSSLPEASQRFHEILRKIFKAEPSTLDVW